MSLPKSQRIRSYKRDQEVLDRIRLNARESCDIDCKIVEKRATGEYCITLHSNRCEMQDVMNNVV